MSNAVGLLGLGRIGHPIAVNMIRSGASVVGYRRSDATEFISAGGKIVGSAAEVARAARVIIECLPSVDAFEECISGPNGVVRTASSETIVLALGSYPPEVKRAQAAQLAAQGGTLLDGEVSGTPAMTEARQAVVFLSGDRTAAEAVRPVVAGFTDHCFYLGGFGNASTMKLIANHLVAVNNLAVAEAMALGIRAGLDPHQMVEVLGPSAGGSTMFTLRAPMMADRVFEPAPGPIDTLKKYLPMILDMSRQAGAAVPLMETASRLYDKAVAAGRGAQDIAAMMEVLEEEEPAGGGLRAPETPV